VVTIAQKLLKGGIQKDRWLTVCDEQLLIKYVYTHTHTCVCGQVKGLKKTKNKTRVEGGRGWVDRRRQRHFVSQHTGFVRLSPPLPLCHYLPYRETE
jgi:hypothetical protein